MSSDVVRWFPNNNYNNNNINNRYRDRKSTTTTKTTTTTTTPTPTSIHKLIILICLVINVHLKLVLGDSDDNDVINNSSDNVIIVNSNNIINNNNNNNNLNYIVNDDDGGGGGGGATISTGHFTSTWAVHIPNGDEHADQVAADHGFINLGKIVDGYYHFHHNAVKKRSIQNSEFHQNRLDDDHRVRWSEQQIAKSRRKRDFVRIRQKAVFGNELLNDPKWSQMWYLNRGNGLDMNVIPAWKEGITGKGVVVTILDDGLESDHPDLEHNYDPKASYDVNSHDDDPMPHYDMTDSNRHGTRCAGEVAATANNSLCAVGIAFGARVGGVRMLDGDVTDAVEARSLSLNPQHIDIYSASWGPDDDGKTVDGPSEMATRAFIEGVTKGRNGKGSIFIWASGNGGREYDNCNCDGYTNSIWTLSISSATEDGYVPWYSEKCSSTLATTYSSGGQGEKQVVTTDLHHSCTVSHTGTSASAPLAAGIAALVLEANRNLTWRDLQHIVVRTAKPGNLKDETWSRNGVGRRVSHSFGYGLMDAAAMVKVARTWKTVPEQQRCEINAPHLDKAIPPKGHLTLQVTVQHCKGVNYLEHVQAKITLQSQRRGDLQLYLKSPAGTRVTLLTSRSHDVSRSGFSQWPFMSVHTWGEAPHGNWQLEIQNDGRYLAKLSQWDLIFHGTEEPAQPNDTPYNGKSSLDSNYGGELEQNSLFDAETPSGQWRDMQQVGESHVDVQRTTSNDQTGSACLKFAPDQKCIECLQNTFLYEGRCYTSCPERSYMMTEHLTPEHVQSLPLPRDKRNIVVMNQRSLVENQPLSQQKYCATCHYSCLRCHGPNDYDCTECAPDAKIYLDTKSNESYCYPLNRDQTLLIKDYTIAFKQINFNNLSFLIGFFILILLFTIIFVCIIYKFTNLCQKKPDYTRVASDIPIKELQLLMAKNNNSNLCDENEESLQ